MILTITSKIVLYERNANRGKTQCHGCTNENAMLAGIGIENDPSFFLTRLAHTVGHFSGIYNNARLNNY